VRNVGGLADTIVDTSEETLANGTASGFKFTPYTGEAMLACIDRALDVFFKQPEKWREIQKNGMKQDWSWQKSAAQYVDVYDRALKKAAVSRKMITE
jgi:starch synthase